MECAAVRHAEEEIGRLKAENATLRKRLDESCRFTVDPDSEFAKDSMELKEGENG